MVSGQSAGENSVFRKQYLGIVLTLFPQYLCGPLSCFCCEFSRNILTVMLPSSSVNSVAAISAFRLATCGSSVVLGKHCSLM